jgi:hypothetical protein
MKYNLFEFLIKRSDIYCKNNIIDIIVFFTCFRFMILCDEFHDFSDLFSADKEKYILNQRLKHAENDIFNFIKKNFENFEIETAKNFVKENYIINPRLCYSFNPTQIPSEITNSFKNYVMNYRLFIFNIIIRYCENKNDKPELCLYASLLYQLKLINDKSDNYLNDSISKTFVRKVTRSIFGIINISDYNCDLKDKLANLLHINKHKSNHQKLFIDQIGGTKSYNSVFNTINSIINNKNFKNLNQYKLELIKTNANKYDAAAPTALESLINKISNLQNYNISVSPDNTLLPLDQDIEILFNTVTIMKFRFISDPIIPDKISLQINNYFGNEDNYGAATIKSGGTKGNASKKKIESFIIDQLYEEKKSDISSTVLSDLDKYIYNIAYKTMGDFLQILSVRIFEEQWYSKILLKDFTYNFITGDIICGYLGGIILQNSILEKQLDDDYDIEDKSDLYFNKSSYLSPNLSLTLFYNIPQFTACISNYKYLDKNSLSEQFKRYLQTIYEKDNCMTIYQHKAPNESIKFLNLPINSLDDKFNKILKLNMRIKLKNEKSKIVDMSISNKINMVNQKNKLKQAIHQYIINKKIKEKSKEQIEEETKSQKKIELLINNFIKCINDINRRDIYEEIIENFKEEDEKNIKNIIIKIIDYIIYNFIKIIPEKIGPFKLLEIINIDKEIEDITKNQEFRNIFVTNSDIRNKYPNLNRQLIYPKVYDKLKIEIKKCRENLIGGSSSGFGKYKKITKITKITKKRKSKKK